MRFVARETETETETAVLIAVIEDCSSMQHVQRNLLSLSLTLDFRALKLICIDACDSLPFKRLCSARAMLSSCAPNCASALVGL